MGIGLIAGWGGLAEAQTVSTSLQSDVARFYGSGRSVEARGLLTDLGRDAGRGVEGRLATSWSTTESREAPVAERMAGWATEEGLKLAREVAASRPGVIRELVGGLLGEGIPEMVEHREQVYAPASAGGGVGNPFFVQVGSHALLPNTADQWITLTVRNDSASAVAVSGLNFNFQVADSGPGSEGGFGTIDGPNITGVDLVTGTLFGSNNTGTTAAEGNPPQAGLWTVTTQTGTVSLGAGQTATLGRVQLSTVGFTAAASWTLSLRAGPPGGLQDATAFLQPGTGGEVTSLEVQFTEGLVVVPEPWAMSLASALGLGGWLAGRKAGFGFGRKPR